MSVKTNKPSIAFYHVFVEFNYCAQPMKYGGVLRAGFAHTNRNRRNRYVRYEAEL